MNEQQKKRLARFLFELSAMQQVLVQDCEYALKEAFRPIDPMPTDVEGLPESVLLERMVWLRVTVRTFLTWPDATTSFMRRVARIEAEQGHAQLSDPLFAKLQRKPRLKERVKEGFKAWSAAFEVDAGLDAEGQDWEAFRRLVGARNRVTHPVKLEDLYPVGAASTLVGLVAWYLMQMEALMRVSAGQVGINHPVLAPPQLPELDLEELQVPALPHDQIDADSLSSLRRHQEMLRQLFHEVVYLMGWLNGQNLQEIATSQTQFALRVVIRSLCGITEGMGWSARRFLIAAKGRGEICVRRSSQRRIENADTALDRIVAIFDAHSVAFGNSYRIDRAGDAWRGLKDVWRVRDQLTHPGRVSDLMLSRVHVQSLAKALDWHIAEVGKALKLDVDRWVELTSSV